VFAEFRSGRSGALLVLIAALACLAVAGCGSDDDSTEATDEPTSQETAASTSPPADLVNEGEFTVCTDPTYPPLESFDENGEYIGFDIDTATAVAEIWGVEPAFQETSFSGILPALDSGRCDVAWSGLFIDPERTKTFSAVPLQETASVIMVPAGNPEDISSPEDLAGRTVTSQTGSNLLRLAQQISDENEANGLDASNVQGYDKFNDAIQQVASGRAAAAITQDIDVAAREQQQPGLFETAYTFPDAETFGVYYKPDNPELGEKLYDALAELEQGGQLETFAEDSAMPAEGIAVDEPIEAKQG
jgi:polar amino acid transport system substrate-binding protein